MVALIDSELDHSISSTTGSLARLPVEDTPSTSRERLYRLELSNRIIIY
jgi:hypothetical protein